MNKKELKRNLKYLIEVYIDDRENKIKLRKYAKDLKAKYVLSEIEKLRSGDYKEEDVELMKDIYFYYC